MKRDPTELGAAPYIEGSQRAGKKLWFCSGNHEDFDIVGGAGSIDPFGMISHLASGEVSRLQFDQEELRVVGVDGIEPQGTPTMGREAGDKDPRRFISDRTRNRLGALEPGCAEVFLCHEAPAAPELQERFPGAGSKTIAEAILRECDSSGTASI